MSMIDVNVSVGMWPFQASEFGTVEPLLRHLRRQGITSALISHLGGVFAPDPNQSNVLIANALLRSRNYHAIPIVNPALNGWRRDLEALPARPLAVRIVPAYHNYSLRNRRLREFVEYCVSKGTPICLQVRLDDERTRYFGLKLRRLDVTDIGDLATRYPEATFVILNAYLPEIKELAPVSTNTVFDTSFAEWLYTVECLLDVVDESRLLFGSHTPLLATQAVIMKVFDQSTPARTRTKLASTNARRVFGI